MVDGGGVPRLADIAAEYIALLIVMNSVAISMVLRMLRLWWGDETQISREGCNLQWAGEGVAEACCSVFLSTVVIRGQIMVDGEGCRHSDIAAEYIALLVAVNRVEIPARQREQRL